MQIYFLYRYSKINHKHILGLLFFKLIDYRSQQRYHTCEYHMYVISCHGAMLPIIKKDSYKKNSPSVPGFEPGIFWSVVRRVIRCATHPYAIHVIYGEYGNVQLEICYENIRQSLGSLLGQSVLWKDSGLTLK